MGLTIFVCLASWLVHIKAKAASLNESLCVAASRGDTAAVERLLRRGANPNGVGSIGEPGCDCEDNPSPAPAMWATSPRMVKFLLSHGAQVNLKDDHGHTALDHQMDQTKPAASRH